MHFYHQYQRFLKRPQGLTQLTLYLEDNKIIHPHQYGFRKRHSTEYAALHITDYINYKMDIGKIPVNVYLENSLLSLTKNVLKEKY